MDKVKLGSHVTIKACSFMPELVGKTGKVVIRYLPSFCLVAGREKYSMDVLLDTETEVKVQAPNFIKHLVGEEVKTNTRGPFPFRPDELSLIDDFKGIPDAFKKADWGEKDD